MFIAVVAAGIASLAIDEYAAAIDGKDLLNVRDGSCL
jgi:hypothetical protein